ncbi:hypothetical protein GDO78_001025 [Eleutherodactylus coqui]|uniref:Uncharacterized protein n=1 Tax=Eleutherodactylus coqui TaxID=57060 RepID=A0A8J6FU25_ELECQ|nr:hypothetical protein GDO78_001025 [Eleutherodactylus coqui]
MLSVYTIVFVLILITLILVCFFILCSSFFCFTEVNNRALINTSILGNTIRCGPVVIPSTWSMPFLVYAKYYHPMFSQGRRACLCGEVLDTVVRQITAC